MKLRNALVELKSSAFARAVGVLAGGTVFAHLITLVALPIITRLYTPEHFSVLAVFTSLVSTVAGAACLRFDVAVPIPEHDRDAINMLALAVCVALLVGAALLGCVALFSDPLLEMLNRPEFAPYLWLVPLGIAIAGMSSAIQFWFVRKREFDRIVHARIGQSGAVVTCQLACGWLGLAPLGLLLGQLLNGGASLVALTYRLRRAYGSLLREINVAQMRTLSRSYSQFPKYSALEALANNASVTIPIVMIAALALGPEAGYVNLAMYVFQAPISLLGGAIAQVYTSRAPEEHRAGRLGEFTTGVFGGLLKSGVGPLIFAGIVGPDAFALIFGNEWRRAGLLAAWMTPWVVLQFLAFPISMALPIAARQKLALKLMSFGLVTRVASVYAALLIVGGFLAEAYALSGAVFYGAYLAVIFRVVGADASAIRREVREALPLVFLWVIAAIAVLAVLRFLLPI